VLENLSGIPREGRKSSEWSISAVTQTEYDEHGKGKFSLSRRVLIVNLLAHMGVILPKKY
jgi:hypothetical protein